MLFVDTQRAHKQHVSERGNILVYVLGAILLLGVLMVVMRGSNQQGSNIDQERLIIRVTEVQRYGAELEQAVRSIFQSGYSEADIRFAHPNAPSAYGDITSDRPRQVFDKRGGAARYRDPPPGIQSTVTPWVFNAHNIVNRVGSTGTSGTTSAADLIGILPNVTQAFCVALNDASGITNPSGIPPRDSGSANVTSFFTGTYAGSAVLGDTGNYLDGKTEGCFEGGGTPSTGTYHYYRVLLSR